MAVKIRLTRRGRKKLAIYDVIVADAKSPRDGRLIDKIGTYNPLTNPATIEMDDVKALDWLMKGAQPTDTARRILSYKGLMLKKHLQIGVQKGAITQEQADKKFEEWLKDKESAIGKKVDSLSRKKADAARERLEAERKINEAKAEALRKKNAVPEPENETASEEVVVAEEEVVEAEAEVAEEVSEQAPAAEEKVDEVPVAETSVEEAPVAEAEKTEDSEEETKA